MSDMSYNEPISNVTSGKEYNIPASLVVEIVFRLLIYVVGVVGNSLVIFVILFLKDYKKITHWYVLQLAIADTLFLQTLAVRVDELITGVPSQSVALCRARQTILYLNYYASIFFLVAMAIDRYLAVCHSLSAKIQRIRSHSNSVIIAFVIWTVSLVLCTPVIMYSDMVGFQPECRCEIKFPSSIDKYEWCKQEYNETLESYDECINVKFDELFSNQEHCHAPTSSTGDGNINSSIDYNSVGFNSFDWSGDDDYFEEFINNETSFKSGLLHQQCAHSPEWHIFVYLNFITMFVIPLIVISFCYSLIVARLSSTNVGETQRSEANSRSSKKGSGIRLWKRRKSSNASTKKSYKEKKRVTIMCAVLVLLFVACWLPFHAVHLARVVGISADDENFCIILTKVAAMFAYLNSAFNPYLYNFLGTFQKRMRQVRSHKRMRAILSVTGLTRIARSSRSGSRIHSSEGSKSKRSSGPNDASSMNQPSEAIHLQTIQSKTNSSEK